MAGIRIEGNTSGNVAEVTANNELKAALSLLPANIGGIRMYSENDSASNYLKSPWTSTSHRLKTATDTILFTDIFNASAQNTNNWSYVFSTMTASQPGNGVLQFGTVQGTASGHGAYMRTFQYFSLFGTAPLVMEFTVGQFVSPLTTSETFTAGFGVPGAAGTTPSDGIWLQIDSSGIYGILSYNGTLTTSAVYKTNSFFTTGSFFKLSIVVSQLICEFWVNDTLLGTVSNPAGQAQPFLQANLPIFFQKWCSGVVSNTNIMKVGYVTVTLADVSSQKPWNYQMAALGNYCSNTPNGTTQGKTAIWANNTAPTAVALTNTIAAFTGLGGISAILPTLAANSDGIIFSWQNPASTVNITGRNLYITGVYVHGVVTVVLAGGPVMNSYAIAYGHTAVSLATTETGSFTTATSHMPRIVPIGIDTYALNAAVGVLGTAAPLSLSLSTPIVVRPGEFVQLIARNLGTVTTTGAITITATFNGFWE